jgi:hypothetical protein
VPDWTAFYVGLVGSQTYQAVLAQRSSNPDLQGGYVDVGLALTAAMTGTPIPAAVQNAIWTVLTHATLTPGHMAELQALLVASHLDGILSLEKSSS